MVMIIIDLMESTDIIADLILLIVKLVNTICTMTVMRTQQRRDVA